jgi:hypothetical protein
MKNLNFHEITIKVAGGIAQLQLNIGLNRLVSQPVLQNIIELIFCESDVFEDMSENYQTTHTMQKYIYY